MVTLLNRRINVEEWLVYSTVISVFLIVRIARAGVDIFLGYPIIIFNTLLLLLLGRLVIHRAHAITIGILVVTSTMAANFSPTPVTAILAQTVGILLFSVFYFSILLTSGLMLQRWMHLYATAAFYLALYGIAENLAQHFLHYDALGEQRLKAIFREPSMFVYTTLPAIGYYINAWVSERRYGLETLVFLLAYVLANSALGFFGLLLIGAFTFIKRFTPWHILAGLVFGCAAAAGLFFGSEAVQGRATNVYLAVSHASLAHTNGSTFAFLSNMYVAGNAVADHPLLGVGIGGYRETYLGYIGDVTADDEKNLQEGMIGLNMDDANSLFVRVTAELGPIGLIVLFGFLIVCANVEGASHRRMRNALLPYFLVRMSRYGAYFSMELYFFVGLYLLNYLDYRRSIAAGAPVSLSAPTPSQPVLRPA